MDIFKAAQDVSLRRIISICHSIGRLMDVVMDRNSLAMIVGSTGEITFTRQGAKVLSETSFGHPVEKMIVRGAVAYHHETGDDCKCFITLLNEIMNGVDIMLQKYEENYIRRSLAEEISRFLSLFPTIIQHIKRSSALTSSPRNSSQSFLCDLRNMFLTFFESKFHFQISEILSELMLQFLYSGIQDWGSSERIIYYLMSRFDLFCSKALSPLKDSHTVGGFLLHRGPSDIFQLPEDATFIVLWNSSYKSDDAVLRVNASSLPLKLVGYWKRIEEQLQSWKSNAGISLILTPGGASEPFQALCSQNHVTLIGRVDDRDMANLLYFTGVQPLGFVNDPVESKHVGKVKSIQSLMVGDFCYTHFEPVVSDGAPFLPNNMVLCAPTDELWREYYSECYNSLKVIQQWLYPHHEEEMGPRIQRGEELGEEGKEGPSTYSSVSNEINTTDIVALSIPLGRFEFALKSAMQELGSDRSFQNLYKILDIALLKVMCKLWNIPVHSFKGEQSYQTFCAGIKKQIPFPLEPMATKEKQIYQIFQLVLQLIKIDAIISTKNFNEQF